MTSFGLEQAPTGASTPSRRDLCPEAIPGREPRKSPDSGPKKSPDFCPKKSGDLSPKKSGDLSPKKSGDLSPRRVGAGLAVGRGKGLLVRTAGRGGSAGQPAHLPGRWERRPGRLADLAPAAPELAAVRDRLAADGERGVRELLAPVLDGPALGAATAMLCGAVLHGALAQDRPLADDVVVAAVDLLLRGLPAADGRRAGVDGDRPARRWGAGGHDHPALRAPGRRRADGHPAEGRRRRRRAAQLRRPQPVRDRRQRAAHPGIGEPGADDDGAGGGCWRRSGLAHGGAVR